MEVDAIAAEVAAEAHVGPPHLGADSIRPDAGLPPQLEVAPAEVPSFILLCLANGSSQTKEGRPPPGSKVGQSPAAVQVLSMANAIQNTEQADNGKKANAQPVLTHKQNASEKPFKNIVTSWSHRKAAGKGMMQSQALDWHLANIRQSFQLQDVSLQLEDVSTRRLHPMLASAVADENSALHSAAAQDPASATSEDPRRTRSIATTARSATGLYALYPAT